MKNKIETINFENTLKILDILNGYIDENNEIKPEFYMKLELITKCLSIFSDVLIEEIDIKDVFDLVVRFDFYIKINEILEANKITKNLRLRE